MNKTTVRKSSQRDKLAKRLLRPCAHPSALTPLCQVFRHLPSMLRTCPMNKTTVPARYCGFFTGRGRNYLGRLETTGQLGTCNNRLQPPGQATVLPRWLLTFPTKQSPLDTSFARWRAKVAAFGRSKLSCLAYAQPVPTVSRERPKAATLALVQAQLATSSSVFQ